MRLQRQVRPCRAVAHRSAIFPVPTLAALDCWDESASWEFARSSEEKRQPNACTREQARGKLHSPDTAARRKVRNKPDHLFSKGGRARQTFPAQTSQVPTSSQSRIQSC